MSKVNTSVEFVIPKALNDERLEEAFKTPKCDENGYAENIPIIWASSYKYGVMDDEIKILSYESAHVTSNLYTNFLDEEAVVWNASQQKLFLYIPNSKHPKLAFKGDWSYAKKLKNKYSHLDIRDVYKEILQTIEEALNPNHK